MNADDYLPNAETVAAIEKDIAIYNERRGVELAELKRREPALMTAYVAGVAVLTVVAFLLLRLTNPWLTMLVPAVGVGGWTHARNWVRRDAKWTQQNFRNHIVPVMLGFVPNIRYSNGIAPRSFQHMPKALIPSHNHVVFDDVISGSLNGHRFELFEVRLESRSKNSTQIMFQGAMLACKRREAFPGTLVATRRVGDFRRFMRDLFGSGGLEEISVRDPGLSSLYEFRTDRRGEARKLISGGLTELLTWISQRWRGDRAQLAIVRDDVFLLLPTTREHFELPPIERSVSYKHHIEPMARQFAAFLAIVAEVHKLDAEEPPPEAEPSSVEVGEEAAPQVPEAPPDEPPAEEEPFIRLLGGDDPPAKP